TWLKAEVLIPEGLKIFKVVFEGTVLRQRSFIGLGQLLVYTCVQTHSQQLCSGDEYTRASGQCLTHSSVCNSGTGCSSGNDGDSFRNTTPEVSAIYGLKEGRTWPTHSLWALYEVSLMR
ncbi:hypothetical protein LEMLEM_LOCUS7960, partial [Lemmus lemmus]